MPNINELTGFPPYFINGYIRAQLEYFELLTGQEQLSPIIPVQPTNIDDLYGNYIGAPGQQDPLMIVYDRMLRVNPGPFYRRKREQLVYTIHSSSLENVLNAHRVISEALNRSDAAAQDVNAWASRNEILDEFGNPINHNVYFHSFRVYQLNETRDLLDLSSVRTIFRNKIIIEYDYHTVDTENSIYT
jgi:hypothetical protein